MWPWLVALIAVALILLLVFVGFGARSAKDQTGTGTAGGGQATTTAPTPSRTAGADGQWLAPATDPAGRSVKVPANGVGNPLGSVDREAPMNCTSTDSDVTIQKTHETHTMWTQGQGPSEVTPSGVPAGYARSAEGAMIAGWNSTALVFRGGEISGPAVRETVTGPGVQELADDLTATPPGEDTNSIYRLAPAAYRITDCSPEQVVGEFALVDLVDDQGNPENPQWTVVRVSMIWENGDWKHQLGQATQPAETVVRDLSGWTTWQS